MFSDSVTLIIGASGFIGKQLTSCFEEDKLFCIPTYYKNKIDGGFKFDLLNETDHNKLIIELSKYKKISILFLSTEKKSSLLFSLKPDDLMDSLNVNLIGPHIFLQKILPLMMKNKFGRVIFFSSTKAIRGDVGIGAYAASKSALHAYSRVFSKEYAKYNITSNVISLGYFDGPLWDEIPDVKKSILIKEVPSSKLGRINDIYPLIIGLLKSEYTNGSVINIDGSI